MAGISQSLAGRSGYVRLLPLSIAELRRAKKLPTTIEQMILWGGYPALYSRRITASRWHADYVQTYLERDVRALTQVHDLALFQKFLRLCAGRSGQLLNMANLANEAGIAQSTVKAWLSVLQASFILYLLPPYFQNMGKRLVKMPKLYFYDSGLAAYLLGIHREEHLLAHPLKGALFETLIMSEMMKARLNAGLAENLYFWRDNIGNEIDAVLDDEGVLRAYEIKAASTLHADMLKGLIKWRTLISERSTLVIESAQLISTTPGSYTREGVLCRPWHQFT
jgi:predicted AAA+ superfamily ATPase